MIRRHLFGLRSRMILVLLASALPIAGLLVYFTREQGERKIAEAREEALRRVRVEALHEDRLIDGARQLLLTLARVPDVDPADPEKCSAFLAELMQTNPLYLDLGVMDRSGRIVASALPSARGSDVSGRRFFQEVMKRGGFVVGEYHLDHPDNEPGVDFAYRVRNPARRMDVVLYCTARIEWLAELASREHLSDEGSVLLISPRGQILSRHPDNEQWVGKVATDVPLVRRVLARREGVVSMAGLDGIVRLHAFVPLGAQPGVSGYLVVAFSERAVLGPARESLRRALFALGAVVLLTLLGGAVLSEWLVLRRVRRLAGAARALGEGDLGQRVRLAGGDELADLSGAFDRMADSLEGVIAGEKRARAEAVQAAERLQTLVDMLPDGVVLIGQDGAFLLSNAAARWLIGPWADRSFPEAAEALGMAEHLSSSGSGTLEFETERQGRVIGHQIARTSAEAPFVWVFRDLTEPRQLMATVIQRSKMADLGLLAAGIAHEIGNPLSSIAATLEVLQMRELPADVQARLRTAQSGLDRIDRIVKDVTGFARPSAEDRVPLRPGDLVGKALAMFRLHEKARGKETELALEVPASVTVDVIEVQMVQVLLNVLLNAADATNGTGNIRVTVSGTPAEVRIGIADRGVGMTEEVRRHLFSPFFTTKEPGKGVGLGLFVSHAIVGAHGGRIEVASEPERGSTFTIRLPATGGGD